MARGEQSGGFAVILLVLALCAVVFFTGLGSTSLTDRDEGEYASSVAEMARTGNLLTPHLNGRTYLEKPILTFWLVLGSYKVFGHNEFAVRLPSALCAALLVLLTFLFGRKIDSESFGFWAALCLSLSLGTLLIGRTVLTDMPLTLFVTAGLYAFFLAVHLPRESGRGWFIVCAAFLGLAFLTKGPVGLAICLAVAGVFVLVNRILRDTIRAVPWLWGAVVFLLVAGPWYAAATMVNGAKFIHGFFLAQNVGRAFSVALGHGGAVLFYLPVLLIFFFPWFGLSMVALFEGLFLNPRAGRLADPAKGVDMFAALWVVVVLVLFSLAATKQWNYIYPVFPALALLAARSITRLERGEMAWPGKLTALIMIVPLGLALAALFIVMGWVGGQEVTTQVVGTKGHAVASATLGWPLTGVVVKTKFRFDSFEYAMGPVLPELGWMVVAAGAACAAAVLFAVLAVCRRASGTAMIGLAGSMIVFLALLLGPFQARVLGYLQEPARVAALMVKAKAAPADRVVTYALWKPTLFFYLDRPEPVERIQYRQHKRLAEVLADKRRVWVITRSSLKPELTLSRHFRPVAERGGYLVGTNDPGKR